MKGNIVELAIAVVLGVAFAALVKSFTANVIMPIIGILGGQPTFNEYTITINKSVIIYGTFITEFVSFLIIAAVLFFVMKGLNKLMALRKKQDEAEAELAVTEVELLEEIRDLLAAGRTS